MALFEKFTDTIFLKEENSLEKQLNILRKERDKVLEKDRIEKDIKLLEYGLYGENEIVFELKNANVGMYVLHDVVIQCGDIKAQIDFVIVTSAYTYFVECKNLIGNITVDKKGEFVREYNYAGKKIKEAIYSPYTQAMRHKDLYMKIWNKQKNGLIKLLFEKAVNNNYKPLIVLANSKGILNTRYAPKEIRDCTIRVDNLISYIKKDIASYDKMLLSNKKEMLQLANYFIDESIEAPDYTSKYTYLLEDDSNNNDVLRKALIEFRTKRAKEKGIPPYYVFNNDELELLLKSDISSVDDLRNNNILPAVKINSHGKEIVEVILKYKVR